MKEKQARKFVRKDVAIRQVAALPFRESATGEIEVMLLTSRETSRFIIPKGWPMKKLPDWKAAGVEARQEAGLIGAVGRNPIGSYQYWKRLKSVFVPVSVAVFAMEVKKEKPAWREMGMRQKRWLTVKDAVSLIDEPDLSGLIERFGAGFRSNPQAG